jgi:hypothetical protein
MLREVKNNMKTCFCWLILIQVFLTNRNPLIGLISDRTGNLKFVSTLDQFLLV